MAKTKTSPAHPQCNSQVEVFNKTVKKYLASFVNDTALNWETFLPVPALALSYNTGYQTTNVQTVIWRNKDVFIMARPHLQSISTSFKNYEKLLMIMPQQMVKKQKNNMTNMRSQIHSKSVIKC
jgi:hypothetical protein